jgi:hypothetical protein
MSIASGLNTVQKKIIINQPQAHPPTLSKKKEDKNEPFTIPPQTICIQV